MGSDCPVDIVFGDDTRCEEINRKVDESFDTQTSYVVCKCGKKGSEAIYDFHHNCISGQGYRFDISLGKERAHVRWIRPKYQWVRIEITQAAAKLLNAAYKYSEYVHERNFRMFYGNKAELLDEKKQVVGMVDIGENLIPLLSQAGEDYTFRFLNRESIQYNVKKLTYNIGGPGGWHNNEHYPRHLSHEELAADFMGYKKLSPMNLPAINE
jgi:hypothetical protein